LKFRQAQVREEVADVECWVGETRRVEVKKDCLFAIDENLLFVKVPVNQRWTRWRAMRQARQYASERVSEGSAHVGKNLRHR
jgi:hypothetical protein